MPSTWLVFKSNSVADVAISVAVSCDLGILRYAAPNFLFLALVSLIV